MSMHTTQVEIKNAIEVELSYIQATAGHTQLDVTSHVKDVYGSFLKKVKEAEFNVLEHIRSLGYTAYQYMNTVTVYLNDTKDVNDTYFYLSVK